ncbi:MAG: 4-hydroxy-tetrahydrodipicolinate synthase [Clostridia bacterium]|nr:4-hydroxy-tetrahydrodipicolinate synthase [Clostridia bacterium]MBQ3664283.1 4-hydroxy-tetrahydrodipicolinate synthase [Clostridia bacterium]MCR5073597.1 4-hydroxy-tetrahydrodipicolinate synthase [Clostridiales bacterium]
MSVFKGSAVAMITPFKNGAVDFTAFTRLIELQIASGTDAIVAVATTGEGSTLSMDEKLSVLQFVVERVNGRVPVIAASGGNNTEKVIELSRSAEAIGADALLVVTPYYNKTTQAGLVAHYSEIADNVDLPIIVYNVPSRTGLNVQPATMAEMMRRGNIVGIKEASGNIEQIVNLAAMCPECDIYSGNDDHVLPVLSIGGKGVISTIANVMPNAMHALCEAYFKGDTALAREIQIQMIPLWKAAFCEVNPIPVKAMMGLMKLCEPDVRLPLVPLSPEDFKLVRETLEAYELI